VVIDHTFATRDLIRGIARNPSYRVLALGEKPTRLFEGQGSNLVESHAAGFPCFVEGARGEPLASGGFADHSSRSEPQELSFFRDVDRALRVAVEDRAMPLVVAGTERDLAYFDEVTTHGAWIVGRIKGNYESASPTEVARLALPSLDAYLASQRAASIRELAEAVPGRTAVGVKAAWSAARDGRARALLVEDDFVYPAREVDGILEPAGDGSAPGVIDDAIDELVEMVLDNGGDVLIVEPGELGRQGPVAVLLRYPNPERIEA
jgi:hypothetical protein